MLTQSAVEVDVNVLDPMMLLHKRLMDHQSYHNSSCSHINFIAVGFQAFHSMPQMSSHGGAID